MHFLFLVFLIHNTLAIIGPTEIAFVCQYDNVPDFPVRCVNASQACLYSGLFQCQTLTNVSLGWNETITDITWYITPFSVNNGAILVTQIGNLLSLQTLAIIGLFTGGSTIPTEIGLCSRLIGFDVVESSLIGTLPYELLQLPVLSIIILNDNKLTGTLPTQLTTLPFAQNLEVLVLRNNQFSGYFPSPVNMTNLYQYDLSENAFTGDLPYGFSSPNLKIIDISNCLANGSIPSNFILNSSPYLFLNMRANDITGSLPSNLFTSKLNVLDASYNRLKGTLPTEVALSLALSQFILTQNSLSGTLPTEFNTVKFNTLFKLNLAYNQFSGTLPTFSVITQSSSQSPFLSLFDGFVYITLNDNNFSGIIPVFSGGSFFGPTSIDLSNNGQLSLDNASFGPGVNISWLNLAGNNMSGLSLIQNTLFSDSTRFTSLLNLDLSYCQFSGPLPLKLHAQYIKMNNNFFTGTINSLFINPSFTRNLPVFIDLTLNRLGSNSEIATPFGGVSTLTSRNTEIVVKDFPQDFDECLSPLTNQCQGSCVDGWYPVPGYTCACNSGFVLSVIDKTSCSSVCGDGILVYPFEQCDFVYSPFGCTFNCTPQPGYTCDGTGCHTICGDGVVVQPEECDTLAIGCNPNCTVKSNYTCQNNVCQFCATNEWQALQSLENNTRLQFPLFYSLGYDMTGLLFTSCLQCSGGFSVQTRNVINSIYCINVPSSEAIQCSYACSNLTIFTEANAALYTLKQQFDEGDFLNQILGRLFNVTITIVLGGGGGGKKREDSALTSQLQFIPSSCLSNTNMTTMMQIINLLSLDIAPNTPALGTFISPTNSCHINMVSTNPVTSNLLLPIGAIVGISVAALLLILLVFTVGLLTMWYTQSDLHSLPKAIAWSFIDKLTHPWRWRYNSSGKAGYYSREYAQESDEYSRVEALLASIHKKGTIQLDSIVAIYNPALTTSFINQWKMTITRLHKSVDQFFAVTYKRDENKMKVIEYYETQVLLPATHNKNLDIPLIGALHGTDYAIAEKIAATGFAALSSLDAGFFGKGIYFTTFLLYTLPYCCGKRNPCIILSYLNMV